MGINIDDGSSTLNSLFGRQAFVGIENAGLGSLSLGRQYTPFYTMTFLTSDVFGVGMMGAGITCTAALRAPITVRCTRRR